MFQVSTGQYILLCQSTGLPSIVNEYFDHASLVEQIDLKESAGTACFLAVGKPPQWPFLVVAQRYSPGPESGFNPGALIIPETDILFLGAGERLLAFDLTVPATLWEDTADTGFWNWARHGDTVIMSAELECAAWDLSGCKLWTTLVEPPWEYSVSGETLTLNVIGKKWSFSLKEGPQRN